MRQTKGSDLPERQDNNAALVLNIASTRVATYALGPGLRSVVWVQGCAFHCPGCIAPDWIPLRPARLVEPEILAGELLSHPDVTGITFSGGEPMLQAEALAALARILRTARDVNIICFTGFQKDQIEHTPPGPGVQELLDQVDVLIDGPYIARLNDNIGLRGSRNQRIHYLTDRLKAYDLDHLPRKAEVVIRDGQAVLTGVPPLVFGNAFNQAVDLANEKRWELLRYERV